MAYSFKFIIELDFDGKMSVAETPKSAIEALIYAGKTNAEIWAIVQPKFQMPETRKTYPSWYRWNLKRLGKLP